MAPLTRVRSVASRHLRDLLSDDRGVSAIIVGLLAGSLIGVVGMGVEMGLWFADGRSLQTEADAAAIAGAYQAAALSPLTTVQSTGITEAQNNGFSTGGSNTIAISETTYNSLPAVQAVLTTPKAPTLLSVFSTSNVNVQATAIATYGVLGDACILTLDTNSADQGILLSGSASVNAPNCILASNGTGPQSIYVKDNGSSISARELYSAGGVTLHSSSNLVTWNSQGQTTNVPPLVNQKALANPFSGEPAAAPPGSCVTVNGNAPQTPGYYCDMSGYQNGTYPLQSGTYYVASIGSFSVKNSILSGSGVTIYLIGNATLSFKNSTITLTAPLPPATTSTPWPGMVIIQDPGATVGNTALSLGGSGNGSVSLGGAVYAPNGIIAMQGTPTISGSLANCLVVVAYQVSFNGNSGLTDSQCSGAFGAGYSVDQVNQIAIAE